MIEARAVHSHQLIEFVFAGVAERRMADIVHESESLGKFGVEAECRGDGASDLRNFQGVGEPIAEMIGVADREDLSLGFEAAKGAGMDDAVAIPGIDAAVGMRWFRITAAA